jgi:hypothetical protein
MTSLFKKPEMPKTALPTPEVPAIPQKETKEEVSKFLKRRSGRAKTILTGSLEPMDIGKRTLLG